MSKLTNELLASLEEYKTQHPKRASSIHRSQNIQDITDICKQYPDSGDEHKLLNVLEDYFSNNDYYTGPLDRSALEDLIVDAICRVNQSEGLALNTFGYFPEDNTPLDQTPEGARDDSLMLEYSLQHFIEYALDCYESARRGNIPEYRKADIANIRELLGSLATDSNKAESIKNYVLEELSHSFNSSLKGNILQALEYFHHHAQSRRVATRIWNPDEFPKPRKLMIFLHGWLGSVNSGDLLAAEAVQEGFQFIAYDHRCHGKDTQRNEGGINSDLLRIDFRVFLMQIKSQFPNASIALVGHSMGGAILTAEHEFINRDDSVKSVSLIAPAVAKSWGTLLSPVKIFARNMHPEVKKAEQSSERHGGNGILTTLLGLINFMRQTASALSRLFNSTEKEDAPQWNIYSGKKDLPVNCAEFESLPVNENHRVTFFSRADHVIHYGRHCGSYIRQMLTDLRDCFEDDNHLHNRMS